MVAHSLKNFFKCLVYVFVPLGCVFLGALVFGFVSLLEAYLLHARGRLPFGKVVNLKNCLLVYASQLAVFAAAAAVCMLVLLAVGLFVAYALVVAVVIIALLVNNVNAESYVARMVRDVPLAERRMRPLCGARGGPRGNAQGSVPR